MTKTKTRRKPAAPPPEPPERNLHIRGVPTKVVAALGSLAKARGAPRQVLVIEALTVGARVLAQRDAEQRRRCACGAPAVVVAGADESTPIPCVPMCGTCLSRYSTHSPKEKV